MTPSLAPNETFVGHFFYPIGDLSHLNLSLCHIWIDVGTAINNWLGTCFCEFYFANPFGRYDPPGFTWGQGWYEIGETVEEILTSTTLNCNYPNPFNSVTNIDFSLPASGDVTITVYNLAGQAVDTIVDGQLNAGNHTVMWDASAYSSGTYFYVLTYNDEVLTRKMTLLK